MTALRYRVLVAGCGSIGQRHARLLAERPEVDLFLADPLAANRAAAAAAAAVPPRAVFADYGQALRAGMDAVFVCSPNHLHVPMTLAALAAGAHVLLEKPAAPTAAEAAALIPARDRAGTQVAVGYANRFDPLLGRLKAMLDRGELGEIVSAEASVYTYATLVYAKTPFRLQTRWALVVDYTHEIDFLRCLLGDIAEVAAFAAARGRLAMRPDPNVIEILLRFRSGVLGRIHMDYARHPDKRWLELVGDTRSAELEMAKGRLRVFSRDAPDPELVAVPPVRDTLFRDQIADFLDAIGNGRPPRVPLEDGLAALRVADAVIRAAETRAVVPVADAGGGPPVSASQPGRDSTR